MSGTAQLRAPTLRDAPDVMADIPGGTLDPRRAKLVVATLEVASAIAAAALTGALLHAIHAPQPKPFTFHIGLGVAFAATFVPLELAMSRPRLRLDLRPDISPDRFASAWILATASALAIAGLLDTLPRALDHAVLATVCAAMVAIVVCQRLAHPTIGRLLNDGSRRWDDIRAALGRNVFVTQGSGPRPVSLVNCEAADARPVERLVDLAIAAIRRHYPEEVLIFASPAKVELVLALTQALNGIPVAVTWATPSDIGSPLAQQLMPLPGYHVVRLQSAPSILYGHAVKRTFDIAFASVALLLLAPLLLIVAALVRAESPGPSFFRQQRIGLRGQTFDVLKFRTMYVEQERADVVQCVRGDPRVTPLGRMLRRTSIDELPQLFNILAGDMSVVGPRPHAVQHDEFFAARLERYFARRYRRPGLTGWAQINGARGETPTLVSMQRRVDLDLWYVNNVSLTQDMKIIAKTVKEVLASRHAF